MGLFDEIIKTVQEAVAEAKAQSRGPVAPSAARGLRADAEAAAAARRGAQMPQAKPAQAARSAQPMSRQERVQAANQKAAADVRAVEAVRAIRREQERRARDSTSPALRIAAKLRDPQAVRDAFVLAEILQPPLALRPRRR